MEELFEELAEVLLKALFVYVVLPAALVVGGIMGLWWLWDNRVQLATDECCLHYSATDEALRWRDCRDEKRACEAQKEAAE